VAREYPGIRDRVLDEQGELRRHVNIFIDGENTRFLGGLLAAVRQDSEMWIHPALSGGADGEPGPHAFGFEITRMFDAPCVLVWKA
jgi:hypothetical protein